MKRLSSAVIAIAAILVGCATEDSVVMDSSKRPPTTSVEVFKDNSTPTRNYKKIAELSYLGPREDELKAQKRFVEKAKHMGGDAVILSVVEAGQKGGGSIYGFNQSTAWVFKGLVVSYE